MIPEVKECLRSSVMGLVLLDRVHEHDVAGVEAGEHFDVVAAVGPGPD